ncbi:MAG: PhoH family protein, partial [Bacteroidales bacterium]|nr:PhoH family protein [Bacteroidales bacterium]
MSEKRITLTDVDPVEIYGVNNKLFDQLVSHFPKIKAFARGSEIVAIGAQDDIAAFETKLNSLIAKRMTKSTLNAYDVDDLFDEVRSDHKDEVGKIEMNEGKDYAIVYGTDGKLIKARTKNQKKLVEDYYDNDLIFAIGPAGTGKTYTAIALAVRALKNREVKRLILTRPAVEAGERLGFLPGDMKDKLDPYLQPLYDALQDMIPAKKLQSLIEDGTIQIAPLAYMRGRTLDRAFVILDEAQNTTFGQLKMFLTRMGNDAKFIV